MNHKIAMQSNAHTQPTKLRGTGGTQLLRLAIIGLAGLLILTFVGFFIVIPVGYGIAATTMPRQPVGTAPAGFENITLTTADGDRLDAWYVPSQSGATIVLVHGASASREAVRSYAEMLFNNNFGVLAFDQRGQGASEGQTNLYGWQGSSDVAAAVRFLMTQSDVRAIGGLGLSLGGEILLGAASENPELKAIVAEGTTHRSMAEFRAIASHSELVRALQPWVTYGTIQLLTGDAPPLPMLDSIRESHSTQFLFIAAQDASDEVEYAQTFVSAAPGRTQLWIIPNGGHIGGFPNYPDEYQRQVVGFFISVLLDQ